MRRVVFLAVLAATLVPAVTASAETAAEKRVAQQIGSHLKQSGQLQNYRVAVKFHDGVAFLNGSVASKEQRDTAVKLAQQVPGVNNVVCKLECPSGDDATENAGGDRPELTAELEKASFEGAQNDAGSVKQAFPSANEGQMMPIQQNPMMQRQQASNITPNMRRSNMPVPSQRMPGMMPVRQASAMGVQQAGCACNGGGAGMGTGMGMGMGGPAPGAFAPAGGPGGPAYDNAQLPGYAWPSYSAYPNYAALSYPQQYSPTAWPYIGPFYPYPQVPLAWRKVSLEWDDGWWFLDFSSHNSSH